MIVVLVALMFGVSLVWACLPLPGLPRKAGVLGALLLAIAGLSYYAINESGPPAIVSLCFTIGPATVIAVARLVSSVHQEIRRRRRP